MKGTIYVICKGCKKVIKEKGSMYINGNYYCDKCVDEDEAENLLENQSKEV